MPKPATTEPAAPATVASLLDKGDGVLMKRNGVWTYPNAPNDRSGTNLVMPVEFVSDAAVQEGIAKGELAAKVTDANGVATSVGRPVQDGPGVRVVDLMRAGSVEAATELPPNSRPTHDAGRSDKEVELPPPPAAARTPMPVLGAVAPAAPVPGAPAVQGAAAPAGKP